MWGPGGTGGLPHFAASCCRPRSLVVQTGMIEPTFDNSFGPCPQWLWDR